MEAARTEFFSINQVAKKGLVTEYALRMMMKSPTPPPHIKVGKKVLINYPLFLEWLDEQSKKAQ